jgi:excisionase family DNA binding protein
MEEEYLSAEDIARTLRVNIKRVYQWIKDGRLKATNIGTEKRPNYRITRKALQDFLDRSDMS